jgi:hypothetical protein
MAEATPSPESKGVVDESLKQRLKKQPRRQEVEPALPGREALDHLEDEGVELRGQSMRGDH